MTPETSTTDGRAMTVRKTKALIFTMHSAIGQAASVPAKAIRWALRDAPCMLQGNLTTAELCSHSRVGSTTVISQDRDSFRSCGGEDSVALDQEGARRAAHETTLFVLDSRLGKGNLLRLAHDGAPHGQLLAT